MSERFDLVLHTPVTITFSQAVLTDTIQVIILTITT